LAYAHVDRVASRIGRWAVDGAFVCNGVALASAYASPRTVSTASSAVATDEFHVREDTCQDAVVRLLYLGYLRPEKGLEYLFAALAALRLSRPWTLEVVGPAETPSYQERLDRLVDQLALRSRVTFHGYVPYGAPLLAHLRAADVLVLPSLSEGTPHVLVEARANGLPCVATRVGGIPSVVIDRVDALLVPPRDPAALAAALERVVGDGSLRRSLIRNGLERARQQTVDAFVVHVVEALNGPASLAHAGAR
jgi:glycosyltransferase involved in cell wall biosynthesis